ncbi:glycerate kinase [Sulfurimonas sp.]|uniref:glycerate kinase type-2 family protein n=1 Tax=Sulfurimonas sp. TaxID=2022749 RepID=UPI003564CA33
MSAKTARKIFETALESVLPQNFMKQSCSLNGDIFSINGQDYDLKKYKKLYIFGSGKASYAMAKEIEKLLQNKIYKGRVISPYDNFELKKIDVKIGSHPIPDQNTLDSTKALIDMMQECSEDDLYIYLLSGGSSALLELPLDEVNLSELQDATKLMLSNNIKIQYINMLRKHISSVKGGRLAQKCLAQGVVLVASDVIDNPLDAIGSAPLYADESSFEDVKSILEEKDLFDKMPLSIQIIIKKGIDGVIEDTPKAPLNRVTHHIVASNMHAQHSAKECAKELGLSVELVKKQMHGEVNQMVEKILKISHESKHECIILGGECTVDLNGNGKGGRNQHAVLLMLKKLKEYGLDYTFLSASTDGVDGNSDAAGAVVDAKCDYSKLDIDKYIQNFDSYNFFKQTGDLIVTGPTGTNVIDLAIILKGDIDG